MRMFRDIMKRDTLHLVTIRTIRRYIRIMSFTSADRAELVRLFRERLLAVMSRSGLGQSAFASSVGIDRSTLSQILSPANDRLPRLESVAAIARVGQVSLDWLLGLREVEVPGARAAHRQPQHRARRDLARR